VTTLQSKPDDRIVRTPLDVSLVVIGAGLLALSALPVHEHSVSGTESAFFHAINRYTLLPFGVVWAIMQLGNIVTVPIAAAVAAATRRWRLALGILIGGIATYVLAKVVKGIVVRGRPDALLDDVKVRGSAALGRGYVSGHAAVVTLLVVLAWPYLGRRGRLITVALAAFVCLARVHVAAHLPLDIVGGAALGLAVAGLIRLILGHPDR
jgi:membrane-associated phospholipid phosphatase